MPATLSTQNAVSLDQVAAVPVPRGSRSWHPVSYMDAIDYVKMGISRHIKAPIESEAYGLNKRGDQMFAVITLDMGNDEQGLAIGLRQSYNKSLSLGMVAGSQVFVCDNLCFNGSAFKVMRKNTQHVWADFRAMAENQLRFAGFNFEKMVSDSERLKATPCNIRRGHAFLGVMQGEGLLTSSQAIVAHEDWNIPRHEGFAQRNLWGLYNAVTEGLKKGGPATVIDRHVAANDFFLAIANY